MLWHAVVPSKVLETGSDKKVKYFLQVIVISKTTL